MTKRYWLSRWLDHNAFKSAEAVQKSLSSPTVVQELRRAAGKAFRRSPSSDRENEPSRFSILAGRGIDLSGQLACTSDVCRQKQVDELFGRVWHYFDRIIVHDDLSLDVERYWDSEDYKVKEGFLSNVRVLFYLRAIGAEELVEFRPKPRACTLHFDQHAREAGLVDLASRVETIVDKLFLEAKIWVKDDDEGVSRFRVAHPLFELVHRGSMDAQTTNGIAGSPERQALTIVVRRLIAHLSSDIKAAHHYGASLGAVLKTHEMFLQQLRPTCISDVVVKLQLPVLDGLLPYDLIGIRRYESEYFDRFRDSLTKTIRERLKIDPDSDPNKLAEELRNDLIEPRLRDIRTRLTAAQNLMTKKSGVGLVLGAVSTTCGILSGLDPHMAAMGGTGVTLACTGTATAKYLDEARDISMDDMYFLWRAAECVPH